MDFSKIRVVVVFCTPEKISVNLNQSKHFFLFQIFLRIGFDGHGVFVCLVQCECLISELERLAVLFQLEEKGTFINQENYLI